MKSLPDIHRQSTGSRGLIAVAVMLATGGGLATLVDLPMARWLAERRDAARSERVQPGVHSGGDVHSGGSCGEDAGRRPSAGRKLPGDLVRFVNLSEVFGYSPTVCTILLAAVLLDPSLVRRATTAGPAPLHGPHNALWHSLSLSPDALRMVAVTFSGGLTTDLVKLVVTRVRPYAAHLSLHDSAIDTFSNIEGVGGAAMRSFPSGHAAMAAGLASALSWRYPRGTPLFVGIGICAAVQRLTSSSHYMSDVLTGAAIATAWAAFWLRSAERPTTA